MYLVDQVQRAILLIVNFRYLLKSCVTDLEVVFERIRSQSHFGTGYHYLSILFQLQKACPTPPPLQQRRLHVHPPLVQHCHARPPPCHICSADWGPFTRLPQLFPRDQDRAAGGPIWYQGPHVHHPWHCAPRQARCETQRCGWPQPATQSSQPCQLPFTENAARSPAYWLDPNL